ncbi:voltage-dependent L-type calcium channel subunit beta-2a isoform X2 [Tachysurus ichikawai]
MSKTPSSSLEKHLDTLENPALQCHKRKLGRKGRFKGSDGSTSSDTTNNSTVRQRCSRKNTVFMIWETSGLCCSDPLLCSALLLNTNHCRNASAF